MTTDEEPTGAHRVDDAERLARTVPCPECDALVGMACWRNDGQSGPRRQAHAARYRVVTRDMEEAR